MRRWIAVALTELLLTTLSLAAAVLTWTNGLHTTSFGPSGQTPAHDATRYAAPWLILGAVLVLIAGMLVIDVIARVARAMTWCQWLTRSVSSTGRVVNTRAPSSAVQAARR